MTMQTDLLRLLHRGWTSPLRALNEAQCLSLSQRVGDMIRKGIPIEKRWLKLENGKQVREYRVDQDKLARAAAFNLRGPTNGCYFTEQGERDRLELAGQVA